jgi:hypothetical protein
MLILKIIFKNKKYYLNIFLNQNTFKKMNTKLLNTTESVSNGIRFAKDFTIYLVL